jgi:ABC-type nitrate/sulfonate/bicarbonate transport system substrate-binding protein
MRRILVAAVFLVSIAGIVGVAQDTVRIALDWTPNTNHSGIFLAEERGYFADESLIVNVQEPGPTVSLQLVASGRADFAVSMQEYVTMARAQGSPVVSIAALYPHNTSGFAAPASLSITSPADFAHHRYGGWGTDLESVMVQTVMAQAGADPSSVEFINLGTIDFVTALRLNMADFFWIYYGWEGIHAKLEGIDFTYLPLVDLSDVLDYYSPIILTSEAMISSHPEIVTRFTRALARGYVEAALHPEEAAEALLRHAPELDPVLVHASQTWLAGQSETDLDTWGLQRPEVWTRFADWAFENHLIDTAIDASAAFTNDFLPGGSGE